MALHSPGPPHLFLVFLRLFLVPRAEVASRTERLLTALQYLVVGSLWVKAHNLFVAGPRLGVHLGPEVGSMAMAAQW